MSRLRFKIPMPLDAFVAGLGQSVKDPLVTHLEFAGC